MFFLWFWGRPGRSMGWAHMQSAHACAVETHFFVFACFLKNRLHMTSFWLHFGTVFCQQSQFWVKKWAPKNDSKKSDPLDSNRTLWPWPGAPWQPATIKDCSNKKQLSEQDTANNSCSKDLTRSGLRPGEFLGKFKNTSQSFNFLQTVPIFPRIT